MTLPDLSVRLLADAFTNIEVSECRITAIFGNKQTLATLASWARVMELPDSNDFNIWHTPLYIEESLAEGRIVLACAPFETVRKPLRYEDLKHMETFDPKAPQREYGAVPERQAPFGLTLIL